MTDKAKAARAAGEPVRAKIQVRDVTDIADFQVRKAEEGGAMRLSFSAASEYPVQRWYGTEILDFSDGAVMLDRAARGAVPLLFNHDTRAVIGMVDAMSVVKGRLMVTDSHLFDTQLARDVGAMIDGGLRNVSVGYKPIEMTENTKEPGVVRITEWEPYEISIVSVPADPTVGQGRGIGDEEFDVRMVRVGEVEQPAKAVKITVEARRMDKDDGENLSALEAEKQRKGAIEAMCKSNGIAVQACQRWITEGTPLHTVANEILTVMEERGKKNPTAMSDLGLTTKETQKFSVFRAIRAAAWGQNDPSLREAAAFEIECSNALAKQLNRAARGILIPGEILQRSVGREAAERAMSVVPGSKGGYMVDVNTMGFIDILRNRSVMMSMGARQLSGLQGNVIFPRQTGKVAVTWQAGEGASVTAADQTLGQLSMTPKTCVAITDVSEQLLRQATPSAEAFIMADLAADVAIDGVDASAINGTGGAQPLGIKNTTGITTGVDTSSATYAKVLGMPITAGGSNAIRGNPGFITNTAGAGVLMQRQRFTSTDTPLWEGNLMDGVCVGFRGMSSEQLASGNLIFGSFDELVIGDWGVLELTTDSGGTRFNQLQVGIRAMWMVDVMLRYPQAFVVSTNLS